MGVIRTRPEWHGEGDRQGRPGVTRRGATLPEQRRAARRDPDTEWLRLHPDYTPPQRPCGARTSSGLPCGAPLDYAEPVCGQCASAIFHEQFRKPQHRKWALERLGAQELENARRRAEGAEKAAARADAEQRAAEREATAVHVVYYLRTAPGRVKVGTTGDLARRLREYRTDESYLLAVEPGGYDVEQRRHAELRRWRVHRRREDYGEGPEVTARIQAVRAEHGDPTTYLTRRSESEAS